MKHKKLIVRSETVRILTSQLTQVHGGAIAESFANSGCLRCPSVLIFNCPGSGVTACETTCAGNTCTA